jgi:hypothetical protein
VPFEVASDGGSGKVILTDFATAILRYTIVVEDPNAFDASFRMALSWYLAFQLAEPITGSGKKRDTAASAYASLIAKAKRVDAGEGREDTDRDADWTTARL